MNRFVGAMLLFPLTAMMFHSLIAGLIITALVYYCSERFQVDPDQKI